VANLSSRGPVVGASVAGGPSHTATRNLLPLPAVLELVPVGRAYWYSLVRDGKAPKPVKLGKRSLWVEAELDAWISALAEQRAA
jgi:prophage regulatory protein